MPFRRSTRVDSGGRENGCNRRRSPTVYKVKLVSFFGRPHSPRRFLMKLSQFTCVTVAAVAAVCAAGGWAIQRTADFGFGGDDSPTNVKAEFYWSRMAYSTNMNR